jgi:hypothetical protein
MKKIIIAAIIVAFSTTAFAAGEVLKLNTKGKQYCAGSAPLSFNSKNDIDLWLTADSLTSVTLYTDESQYVEAAVINIRTTSISATKLSFNGFSGNSTNHISVAGTFTLDSNGYVKAVNATMIRRGVLNSCYSNAVVSGKRVL